MRQRSWATVRRWWSKSSGPAQGKAPTEAKSTVNATKPPTEAPGPGTLKPAAPPRPPMPPPPPPPQVRSRWRWVSLAALVAFPVGYGIATTMEEDSWEWLKKEAPGVAAYVEALRPGEGKPEESKNDEGDAGEELPVPEPVHRGETDDYQRMRSDEDLGRDLEEVDDEMGSQLDQMMLPELKTARDEGAIRVLEPDLEALKKNVKVESVDEARDVIAKLLAELEHHSKWEGVRLAEAVRDAQAQAQQEMKLRLQASDEHHKKLVQRELEKQRSKLQVEYDELLQKNLDTKVAHEVSKVERQLVREWQSKLIDQGRSLRKEFGDLRDARVAEVAAIERKVEALEKILTWFEEFQQRTLFMRQLSSSVLSLEQAVRHSKPLSEASYAQLRSLSENDPTGLLAEILKTLPVAGTAIPSLDQLKQHFVDTESAGIQAALMPENLGPFGYVVARIASMFVLRPSLFAEGESAISRLHRASISLTNHNLAEAVTEVESIDDKLVRDLCHDWLKDAKERLATEQAVRLLKAHVASLGKAR